MVLEHNLRVINVSVLWDHLVTDNGYCLYWCRLKSDSPLLLQIEQEREIYKYETSSLH